MNPERNRQIDQVFQAALEREPVERAAFLDEACGGDAALRREVEALLDSHRRAGSFIESPALEAVALLLADQNNDSIIHHPIGPYRILSHLGSGGMGEVYLAKDGRLGRKVALKILPEFFTRDVQRVRRFKQEARAASALNHPNIITIHEIGESEGRHFIATEYVEGETLRQRLGKGKLSLKEALDVAVQVTSGLAAAHHAGIVHRDIKPENIMLRRDEYVKVLDFGLAKLIEEPSSNDTQAPTQIANHTDPGIVMGTIRYMSPEQARGKVVDSRTDIFSLGVMLYEMMTGYSPFDGESAADVFAAILQKEPAPLANFSPEATNELQRVVNNALRKDRNERYQMVDDLLVDLRNLRDELHVPAARLSVPPAAGASLSRRIRAVPFAPKVGVSLVLLAVLVTWFGFRIWRRFPDMPSAEARPWYEQGVRDMHAVTYYQASKELEQCIALDDNFAPAHARLAGAYLEIDNDDRAMEELLRALTLAPNKSMLSAEDSLYLDAVAATIRREFSKAIDYYRELADKTAEPEKASALIDLGRAYDRNEQVDKAQENYLAATQKDPRSAAAFLRLAIIYGRRQDPKSEDAFLQAEKYYRLLSNQEGVAEVFYQRGALLAKLKKLAEAKSSLEEALKLAQNLADNKYQLVKTQLQLSSIYYNEGDTERAKKTATNAIELAQKSRIQNLATTGLIDLGYKYFSRREFNEAKKYFQQALDFALVYAKRPFGGQERDKATSAEAKARRALGALNQQQGNNDDAISFLEQALSFYVPAGYRKEASTVLLLLGRAYRDKGDYETAFKNFNQILNLATEMNDQALRAATHVSIAILRGSDQERYPEALTHLDESYEINSSLDAWKDQGFDQMHKGFFLWRLGRYQEAATALDLAFSIANRPEASLKALLAWVHLTNAQMALSQLRLNEAKAKGQQALDAGNEYRDVVLLAKSTIGLATALSGQAQPARKLCEEAVAIAKEEKSLRLESSALLALAEVQLAGNDAAHALRTTKQAQAILWRSGQQDSEWQSWLLAARASELAGNRSEAQACASRADSLCAGLQEKWGTESYESYLRRPDIENYRRQLAQIFARTK